jgi:endogenous inhibitor of DNA gyrase (YacG/DUF329 family)
MTQSSDLEKTPHGEKKGRCPQCKTDFTARDLGSWPFCSSRCKQLDLGAWASGRYRIPGSGRIEAEDLAAVKEREADRND